MVTKAERPVYTGAPFRRGGEDGWTLVEMLIVIGLVIIMAGLATGGYGTAVTRSKEAVLKEDLFRMRDAIDQYFADRNESPATLDSLVTDGYLRRIPEDPFTESSSSWETEPAAFDPTDPLALPGVFDVRSGSLGVASDGSVYAEW